MTSGLSSARRSSRAFSSAIDGGRMNTLTTSLRIFSHDLPGALPVDVEHHVLAARQGLLDRLARRAVEIAVHLGPFEQIAALAHLVELVGRDEPVVHAVDLRGALRPRRHRDRQVDARVLAHEVLGQRRLAGARGRRQDQQQPPRRMRVPSPTARHSTFCTCSRNCSTTALRSSPIRDRATSFALAQSVFASRPNSWARKSSRRPTAPLAVRSSRAAATWAPQTVELLADVGARGDQHRLLVEARRVEALSRVEKRRNLRLEPRPDGLRLTGGARLRLVDEPRHRDEMALDDSRERPSLAPPRFLQGCDHAAGRGAEVVRPAPGPSPRRRPRPRSRRRRARRGARRGRPGARRRAT